MSRGDTTDPKSEKNAVMYAGMYSHDMAADDLVMLTTPKYTTFSPAWCHVMRAEVMSSGQTKADESKSVQVELGGAGSGPDKEPCAR